MGVLKLWQVLRPASRTIKLDSLRYRRLAIDASIWLTSFIKAMRDSSGNLVHNAHLKGLWGRICKLLFFGMKPVFVFDGVPPLLKTETLKARRTARNKSQNELQKIAEKLLLNQLKLSSLLKAKNLLKSGKIQLSEALKAASSIALINREDLTPSVSHRVETGFEFKNKITSFGNDGNEHVQEHIERQEDIQTENQSEEQNLNSSICSDQIEENNAKESSYRFTAEELRRISANEAFIEELPKNEQIELLLDMKYSHHGHVGSLASSSNRRISSDNYSSLQVQQLVHRGTISRKLEKVRSSIQNENFKPIASDPHIKYKLTQTNSAPVKSLLDSESIGNNVAQIITISGNNKRTIDQIKINQQNSIEEQNKMAENDQSKNTLQMRFKSKNHNTMTQTDLVAFLPQEASQFVYIDSSEEEEEEDDNDEKEAEYKQKEEEEEEEEEEEQEKIQLYIDDDDFEIDNNQTLSLQSHNSHIKSQVEQSSSNDLIINQYIDSGSEDEFADVAFEDVEIPVEKNTSPQCEEENVVASIVLDIEDNTTGPFDNIDAKKSSSYDNKQIEVELDSKQDEKAAMPLEINNSNQLVEMTGKSSPEIQFSDEENLGGFGEELESIEEKQSSSSQSPFQQQFTAYESSSEFEIDENDDLNDTTDIPKSNINDQNAKELDELQLIDEQNTQEIVEPSTNTNDNDDLLDLEFSALTSHSIPQKSNSTDMSSAANVPTLISKNLYESENEILDSSFDAPFPLSANQSTMEEDLNPQNGLLMFENIEEELQREAFQLEDAAKYEQRMTASLSTEGVEEAKELLRLFGIPFVQSPGEADAQCAVLQMLGLVDGIVSDDSDILVFGGKTVFRHAFSNKHELELYNMDDIEGELGLNHESLIFLALLLGGDYGEGIQKIGPKSAYEIVSEFPGLEGAQKFKELVEMLHSNEKEKVDQALESEFIRNHEKLLKSIKIPHSFPNAAIVDAYQNPSVDSSKEPFSWGWPNLAGLRQFALDKFGWTQDKIDATLVPIFQKYTSALSEKQPKIETFFSQSSIHGRAGSFTKKPATSASKVTEVSKKKQTAKNPKKRSNTERKNEEDDDLQFLEPKTKRRKSK